MGLIYAILTALIQALFGGKNSEQKAVDRLIDEREKTLERVSDAKTIKESASSDASRLSIVRKKYERKDD